MVIGRSPEFDATRMQGIPCPQHRKKPPALIPRAFRRRLSAALRRDISLLHHTSLDALSKGEMTADMLLTLLESVLTWCNVAERLKLGESEMQQELDLVQRLITEFNATGKLSSTEVDLQLARDGVVVMDLLAAEVDVVTAAWAADHGEKMLKGQVGKERLR